MAEMVKEDKVRDSGELTVEKPHSRKTQGDLRLGFPTLGKANGTYPTVDSLSGGNFEFLKRIKLGPKRILNPRYHENYIRRPSIQS